MSLMGSLYTGVSGLQTSQNALNSTAHNMSNLDTTGYTRQQVLQGNREYNTIATAAVSKQQVGLGVTYSAVRQVRDAFLDQQYRRESGRSMFYTTSYQCMTQVETILGELYGATFNNSLEEFQRSVDELAKTPNDSVVQGLVIQRATSFIENAQAVYQGLCDYQDNLNLQIKMSINKINDYGNKIQELNRQIVRIETGGVERANDLRDARNQLLDELGGMTKINYNEDIYGNVTVQIEGHDFVSRDIVYEIGLDEDELTGFYTPFWVMDAKYTIDSNGRKEYNIENAKVFNMQQTISSDLNTDIGGVKAMMFARGDKRADYTDLQDEKHYNKNISQSIIMNVQAEFDQLIHTVATELNGILAGAADPSTGYLCEKVMVDGKDTYQPIQLFQKKPTDGYSYNYDTKQWEYNEEDAARAETLYSTMNMMVNPDLVREPTKLGLFRPDERVDYATAAALAEAFQTQENRPSLNPNVKTKANFMEYYSDLVSQVGNSGEVFKDISNSQADTLEATCSAREQIVGVSSDEELTNMIRFQNAYNASSRYINVISEMLEHLISTLAR